MQWDTADPTLVERLRGLRQAFPGSAFVILDSDHKKAHVLAEMELLRSVLKGGDYLVVEDGNINGHPIYAGWGEGPFEALQEYEQCYPDDYEHDRVNEYRFGFTFAPEGYLTPKCSTNAPGGYLIPK
jgi:cephalosporin hydroxylase